MRNRSPLYKIAVLLVMLLVSPIPSLTIALTRQNADAQSDARGARLVGVRVQGDDGKEVILYNESHALIIGISNYTNGWKVLGGVKQDVPEVKQSLQKHGFVVEELLDKTKAGIRDGVETFINKWGQGENNRLLIYFAGHGETLTTRDGRKVGYIVPVDAPKADPNAPGAFKQAAISLDEVEIWARQIESKHVLFVFDSCFSGALYEKRSEPRMPAAIMAETAGPVRQFITSGTAEQEVPDQSIFRDVFTNALDGAGDLNGDGYVTGTELGMHLRDKVSNYPESAQTPQYWKMRSPGLDKGDFVFVVRRRIEPALIAEQKTRALASIGMAYVSSAEKRKVMEGYLRTLPRRREVNDRYGEAETLNKIGLIYESFGEYESALDCFKRALAFWRSVRERRGESYTLNNIGRIYASLDENEKALSYYTQSLPIFKALFDSAGEGSALTNIGAAYAALGETDKALESLNKSIPLLQAVEDTSGEAITLITVGKIYASAGQKQKALDYFNRALAPLRSVGHRSGEADALSNVGAAYASLGDYAKAIEFYEQALSLRRVVGDRRGEAETLYSIARTEQDRGRLNDARARVEEALEITESMRDQVAGRELRAAYFALGQKQYGLHVDLLQQLHREHPSEGYDAAALLASERARARGFLEMLAETSADIRVGVDPALARREQELQRQLNEKLYAQMGLFARPSTQEQVATVKKHLEELAAQLEDVQTEIKKSNPRYAALAQPRLPNLKEIQQALDPDTLLLEYALGDERSYLWAVTPNSVKSYVLPPREQIERAARYFYTLLTNRDQPPRPDANREADRQGKTLSSMLLGVVAPELGRKRLLIVADGALHYVPFAALPDPNAPYQVGREAVTKPLTREGLKVERDIASESEAARPLVMTHEVVSVPSATALTALRRGLANRTPAPKLFAIFADPVYDTDDERVKRGKAETRDSTSEPGVQSPDGSQTPSSQAPKPHGQEVFGDVGVRLARVYSSRIEAREILSLVPAGGALAMFDFEANRDRALSPELGHYRIIHFSTHSYFDSSRPELSGIFLSTVDEAGLPRNGLLMMHDVYNMRLNSDLVVLSSCRSALGKEVKGEGVVGFARAFMYAGVPRVVASLWNVDDRSTTELMVRFYRGMFKEGLLPSTALRKAQLSLLMEKQTASTYTWGAFVLQGDWR